MSERVAVSLPLQRWQGDRGTYHLVTITGDNAETIAMHARMHRLEFGAQRGFGSIKVMARIGATEWKTSVFPMKASSSDSPAARALRPSTRSIPDTIPGGRAEGAGGLGRTEKHWTLLVSRKVMRAEDLAEGDPVPVELELL